MCLLFVQFQMLRGQTRADPSHFVVTILHILTALLSISWMLFLVVMQRRLKPSKVRSEPSKVFLNLQTWDIFCHRRITENIVMIVKDKMLAFEYCRWLSTKINLQTLVTILTEQNDGHSCCHQITPFVKLD